MRTPLIRTGLRALVLLVFALDNASSFAQYTCEGFVDENGKTVKWNPTRQRIVRNQTVPGTTVIKDWLEFLPDDYNSSNKKYPLLIFFHGINEGGNGNPCRLLTSEWWWTPPVIVERKQFPYSSKDPSGNVFKFIVISPRMGGFGETSNTLNKFLDHLLRTYRVDPSRVFLTGISAGTDYIINFAGASEANARRLAGIMPVSPCGGGISSGEVTNIQRAGLHVYAVSCGTDRCGGGQGDQAERIADAINAPDPSKNLAFGVSLPAAGFDCNPDPHDAWGIAYDTTFKPNIYGRNINAYEWMLQFRSTADGPLPVALEDYDVQLSNGKVYVKWSTSAEENSDHFTIERAGTNQQFIAVGSVPSAGNSGSLKTYEWVDEQPLSNLSFYRLTQTDRDGEKQIFPVRKILNRTKWDRYAIVSPNPFGEELSVYLNVDKTQRVSFTLADMSGRVVKTMNGTYSEGTAEVSIDASRLTRGVYFLKVEGEFFSEVQRVVKQ